MPNEPTRTCKACRWWAPNANGNPSNLPLLVFACKCPKLALSLSEIADNPACAGIDQPGWEDGVLITGPDFGCVWWETPPVPGSITTMRVSGGVYVYGESRKNS